MLVTVREADRHGNASYQSPSWHEYIGDAPGESLRDDWPRFCHPEDRERLLAEWAKALESGGSNLYDIEVRIRRHDGEYRWFRVSGNPIRARHRAKRPGRRRQRRRGDGVRAPAFGRTLIVAVSGFGQPNDVAAARAAGFDHYIVKPYDIDFVKSLPGPRVSQPLGT